MPLELTWNFGAPLISAVIAYFLGCSNGAVIICPRPPAPPASRS
mgnify:CR=1 FL=1